MTQPYKEDIAVTDPGTFTGQFSVRAQKTNRTWLLLWDTNSAYPDIDAAIQEIIGTTRYAVGDGRLQRTPPLADPQFPWLYATDVNVRGYGTQSGAVQTFPGLAPLEVPTFEEYTLYPNYRFVVESTAPPYAVATDDKILKIPGSWYNFVGTQQNYNYATEWMRYCTADPKPKAESTTAQQGQMTFRSNNYLNGQPFGARPKMYLPDQVVSFEWIGVPLRYLVSPNSYIVGNSNRFWLGCVNQNSWTGPNGRVYPSGSLMYVAYEYKEYTPAYPTTVVPPGVGSVPFPGKLCDVRLTFLQTNRNLASGETVPGSSVVNGNLCITSNPNLIVGGWNLQPSIQDRRWHYASTSVPTYTIAIAPNTASPTTITTGTPHGFTSGQQVTITGAIGNTAINGTWTIGAVGSSDPMSPAGANNLFDIAVAGNGAYQGNSATVVPGGASQTPAWFSFPLELLFFDPDAAQIQAITNY